MATYEIQVLEKQPSESFLYDMEFAARLAGDDTLPEVGPTWHPPVARPIEGTRPEAPCVPDAMSDQPMRLTRH